MSRNISSKRMFNLNTNCRGKTELLGHTHKKPEPLTQWDMGHGMGHAILQVTPLLSRSSLLISGVIGLPGSSFLTTWAMAAAAVVTMAAAAVVTTAAAAVVTTAAAAVVTTAAAEVVTMAAAAVVTMAVAVVVTLLLLEKEQELLSVPIQNR